MNRSLLFLFLCTFSSCMVQGQVLIPFSYNSQYGFINERRELVIKPRYKDIRVFKDSQYFVGIPNDSTRHIINNRGDVIYNEIGAHVSHVYKSLFSIEGSEIKIIDIDNGNVIISGLTASVAEAPEGLIAVSFNRPAPREGYININGDILFQDLKIRRAYPFYEGLAVIRLGNWNYTIINKEGVILKNEEKELLGQHYSEGLLPAKGVNGKTGYINLSGDFQFILPIEVDGGTLMATNFNGGIAAIKLPSKNNTWKLINKKGEYLSGNIEAFFINDFSEGVALFGKYAGDRLVYGYLDKSGQLINSTCYDYADDFRNGFSRIIIKGKEGLLTHEGEIIWSADIINKKVVRRM